MQSVGPSASKKIKSVRMRSGFVNLGTCSSKLVFAPHFSLVTGNSQGLCSLFTNCKVRKVLLACLTGLEDKFINICETSDTIVMSATQKPMRKLTIRYSEQGMDVMQ